MVTGARAARGAAAGNAYGARAWRAGVGGAAARLRYDLPAVLPVVLQPAAGWWPSRAGSAAGGLGRRARARRRMAQRAARSRPGLRARLDPRYAPAVPAA